jgi:hypothetical protein
MQTLYAVEAWVLAVVGWAWLTVRLLMPGERPLIEEWANYAALAVSSVTLLLCAVVRDKAEVMKGHLGFMLISWTFLAYAAFDSVSLFGGADRRYVVQGLNSTVCCPNDDAALMNRALYFGGTAYSVPLSAVTLALQTVQVFVASAGAMVDPQGSAWPGNGWGYGVAALLSTVYALRYSPGALEPVCPGGDFAFLLGRLRYGIVFTLFAGGLHLMILLDVADLPRLQRVAARVAGAVLVGLFAAAVFLASDGRGMMTVQLWLLLAKAGLAPVWGVIEAWWLYDFPVQNKQEPPKSRMRWVMPMQTPCLPTQFVMDSTVVCPPRTRVAQEKKRA